VSILSRRQPVGLLLAALVASACPGSGRRDILHTEKKLYSQNDEELIIRDFFQDRRGGFFLDVGASDPVQNSTTYYLEKHLGWTGIGVDALYQYHLTWRIQRPASKYLMYIVTDHSGSVEPFYRTSEPALSSVEPERVFEGKHLVDAEKLEVETITLDKLLDDNGVKKIDFLSMDIEESEPAALAGFDIRRFQPDLVCIEASDSVRERILAYFAAHGYERIDRYLEADSVNWYFQPKVQTGGAHQ
jgi:FkbM family methyltransferase